MVVIFRVIWVSIILIEDLSVKTDIVLRVNTKISVTVSAVTDVKPTAVGAVIQRRR
jgi:hypothetical protein